MPIIKKEDGTYAADGHSWVAKDYQIIDNKYFEIDYLYIIEGDRILEKELKRTDISAEAINVFANG